MSKCYLCGKLLNEANSSVEHIIPNAIGGHLKPKIYYARTVIRILVKI